MGLVIWRGSHQRNFVRQWHWERLVYPFTLFCDKILPARGIIERRADASNLCGDAICKKCIAGLDKATAERLTLERA